MNTSKLVTQIIIIDDSGNEGAFQTIDNFLVNLKSIFNITVITNPVNMGQVQSIDLAYSHVKNPYIFHLEDDWEFYEPGFIERSLEVLEAYPWIVTVWLRAHNDTNGHPSDFVAGLPFRLMALNFMFGWHGFTWNPGLRRLSDYRYLKSFAGFAPGEEAASRWYMQKGYRAAILNVPEGFVRHTGWERSTGDMHGTQKG